MTTYTLADDISMIATFPILDRVGLRCPEFYYNATEYKTTSKLLLLPDRKSTTLNQNVRGCISCSNKTINLTPANCGEDATALCAQATKRIWRPTQLRFEVQFMGRTIFLNTRKLKARRVVAYKSSRVN